MSAVIEEVNSFAGHHEYAVCNENIHVWRELLSDIKVDKAAGISPGGEIAFLAILPTVRTELVLVDHTYTSLCYAVAKYNAVNKLTAEQAWKMLSEKLPQRHYPQQDMFERAKHPLCEYLPESKVPVTPTVRIVSLQQQWASVTAEDVSAFKKNCRKISFLHGDINDLKGRGEFDLLYLSNAMDYAGRNGPIKVKDLLEIVKPGGFILTCYTQSFLTNYASYSNNVPATQAGRGCGYGSHLPKEWERIGVSTNSEIREKYNQQKGYDSMGWKYELVKVPS